MALTRHSVFLGSLCLFVAFLTAFYMTRLLVVVFFNRATSKEIDHAHEVPWVMAAPLAILAVPAVGAGWPFIASHFYGSAEAENVLHAGGNAFLHLVPVLAISAFILGMLLGFVIYRGKTTDPINLTLFRRKFYFDEFYAALIRLTQDGLAKAAALFDRWVIDGA